MWIEAFLSKTEIVRLVQHLLPLSMKLGDGDLHLHEPSEIGLVPDVGLRVVCKARVHWPVLGISVPIVMNSLAVILEPMITEREDGRALVVALRIEHADVAGIPTLIDEEITRAINRALDEKRVELAWLYEPTLAHVFTLPRTLEELESVGIATNKDASVRVTSEALGIAIRFDVSLHRKPEQQVARAS